MLAPLISVKNMRYIKHWPKLVEYEMSVYKRYLAKFCQNETKEWKIGEMWSFQIDSKHNCDFMDESQNNAMRAFSTLMESRATRRGNQVEVKQTLPGEHAVAFRCAIESAFALVLL